MKYLVHFVRFYENICQIPLSKQPSFSVSCSFNSSDRRVACPEDRSHMLRCISALCQLPILSHRPVKRWILRLKFNKINFDCFIKGIRLNWIFFLKPQIHSSEEYYDYNHRYNWLGTTALISATEPAVSPSTASYHQWECQHSESQMTS